MGSDVAPPWGDNHKFDFVVWRGNGAPKSCADASHARAHVPAIALELAFGGGKSWLPVANRPNTRPISATPSELPECRVCARNFRVRAAPIRAAFRIVAGGGTYLYFDVFRRDVHQGQWTKV